MIFYAQNANFSIKKKQVKTALLEPIMILFKMVIIYIFLICVNINVMQQVDYRRSKPVNKSKNMCLS